jgi:hypothetical protein
MAILIRRNSIYSYLSVTPNGDVHLDRPKDDKVIDELFNDLMVPPPPLLFSPTSPLSIAISNVLEQTRL